MERDLAKIGTAEEAASDCSLECASIEVGALGSRLCALVASFCCSLVLAASLAAIDGDCVRRCVVDFFELILAAAVAAAEVPG